MEMETTEKIIKTLKTAGRPLKGGEIASLSGLDKKVVNKTLKELQKAGKIYSPKRCFYESKK